MKSHCFKVIYEKLQYEKSSLDKWPYEKVELIQILWCYGYIGSNLVKQHCKFLKMKC